MYVYIYMYMYVYAPGIHQHRQRAHASFVHREFANTREPPGFEPHTVSDSVRAGPPSAAFIRPGSLVRPFSAPAPTDYETKDRQREGERQSARERERETEREDYDLKERECERASERAREQERSASMIAQALTMAGVPRDSLAARYNKKRFFF
jgi:hypothetical protein